jgi:anti-sigma B factor antagonist
MTELEESLYVVSRSDDQRVVTLIIQAKHLNYDMSDGLKLRLRETVLEYLEQRVQYFVLDLQNVSIVDSCGVGLMIGVHNLIRDRDATLYLTGITHFLEKIFRMMHLDQYFHVVDDMAAVEELAASESPLA